MMARNMGQQSLQGYLEQPSRKRPSPGLAPDDIYDVPIDLMHRPEGHKFPKLDHEEIIDASVEFRHPSSYGDSTGMLYLSNCNASESLSSEQVLASSKDDHACSSDKDEMVDVSQEKQGFTCCYGMVGEKSM